MIPAHSSADLGDKLLLSVRFDAELAPGHDFSDRSLDLNQIITGHAATLPGIFGVETTISFICTTVRPSPPERHQLRISTCAAALAK